MINIVSAYPDYLNLYGEYASMKLLELRLKYCSQEVKRSELNFGKYADIDSADYIFFGAGTENRVISVLDDIRGFYENKIKAFVDRGGILQISGASTAIFCKSIVDERTGKRYEGIGLFDAEAVITKKRRYGELICKTEDGQTVIGAVNSSIDFHRGAKQNALFSVLWDSSKRFSKGDGEGMRIGNNVFASEITGPLICRNPVLMDRLADMVSGEKLPACNEAWYGQAEKAYKHALGILAAESKLKDL